MGLTFSYEFCLPGWYSAEVVNAKIGNLKIRAERLRFSKITPTYDGVVDFLPDDWRQLFNSFADVNERSHVSAVLTDPRRGPLDCRSRRVALESIQASSVKERLSV